MIAEIEKEVLQNPPVDPVANKKQHRHGSTEWISEDLFAGTEGLELRIKCRGRRIANGDDLRVVIAYDRFYDQHPNKDGINPVARAACLAAGDFVGFHLTKLASQQLQGCVTI